MFRHWRLENIQWWQYENTVHADYRLGKSGDAFVHCVMSSQRRTDRPKDTRTRTPTHNDSMQEPVNLEKNCTFIIEQPTER